MKTAKKQERPENLPVSLGSATEILMEKAPEAHEHGIACRPEWAQEDGTGRLAMPRWHLQGVLLSDYFSHSGRVKVLEFGCGAGERLRYLRCLPNVRIYGFDLNPNVAAGCLAWASKKWIRKHLAFGLPLGRLPFHDNQFDIAYTAAGLARIPPQDLETVLGELVRVANWQILHFEAQEDCRVAQGGSNGGWSHDLAAAYAGLGQRCDILSAGYECHMPLRVILDPKRPVYTWPAATLSFVRTMDHALEQESHQLENELQGLRSALDGQIHEKAAIEEQAARAAEQRAAEAETRQASLDEEIAGLKADATRQGQAAQEAQGREAAANLEISGLVEHCSSLQELLEETERAAHEAEQRAARTESERSALAEQLANARKCSEETERRVARSESERSAQAEHLANARQALEAAEQHANAAESERTALAAELPKVREELQSNQEELQRVRTQIEETKAARDALRRELEDQRAHHEELVARLAECLQIPRDATKPVSETSPAEIVKTINALRNVLAELKDQRRLLAGDTLFAWAKRTRNTRLWHGLRWLRNRNRHVATVRCLRERNPSASGTGVFLLRANEGPGGAAIPPDLVETPDGAWYPVEEGAGGLRRSWQAQRPGVLRVPFYGPDPELVARTDSRSGRLEIGFRGKRETFDLYSPASGELRIRLIDMTASRLGP